MNTAMNEMVTSKAQKMYAFIKAQAEAGRTCYLATALRVTVIKKKHMEQVRVNGNALEILCGKRWLDYTHTALSAR